MIMPNVDLPRVSMIVCSYSSVDVNGFLCFQTDLTIGMDPGADQQLSFGPPLPLLLQTFSFCGLCFVSGGVNH